MKSVLVLAVFIATFLILTTTAETAKVFYLTIPQWDEADFDAAAFNAKCLFEPTAPISPSSSSEDSPSTADLLAPAMLQSVFNVRMDIDDGRVLIATHPLPTTAEITLFSQTECGLYLTGITDVTDSPRFLIVDIDDTTTHPNVAKCFGVDETTQEAVLNHGVDPICPQLYGQPCSTTAPYCASQFECSTKNQVCAYPLPTTLSLASLQVTMPTFFHYQSQKASNFFIFFDRELQTSEKCNHRSAYHYLAPANQRGNSVVIYWEPVGESDCSLAIVSELVTIAWSSVTPPFPEGTTDETKKKSGIVLDSFVVTSLSQDQIQACVNDATNTLACATYDASCQIRCGDATSCTADSNCGSNHCAHVSSSELLKLQGNRYYYNEDDETDSASHHGFNLTQVGQGTDPETPVPRACASDCVTVIIMPVFYIATLAACIFFG